MPLAPQPRRRVPHPTAGNHALASVDQNLTEVDARLTKVDSVSPRSNPKPQQTQQNRNRAHYPATSASTLAVNPSGAPRTNLNKPEQIRTNPNTAERSDQIGTPPGSPPNIPKKQTLNTAATHSPHPPSPIHPSPLPGGEVRWG